MRRYYCNIFMILFCLFCIICIIYAFIDALFIKASIKFELKTLFIIPILLLFILLPAFNVEITENGIRRNFLNFKMTEVKYEYIAKAGNYFPFMQWIVTTHPGFMFFFVSRQGMTEICKAIYEKNQMVFIDKTYKKRIKKKYGIEIVDPKK